MHDRGLASVLASVNWNSRTGLWERNAILQTTHTRDSFHNNWRYTRWRENGKRC